MPAVVLGELRTGFALGKKALENERELSVFLESPAVEVLAVEDDTARVYAEIVVASRRAGTPLPTNDIWVAATAVLAGATVLTFDGRFDAIARVGKLILAARCRRAEGGKNPRDP